MDIKVGGHVMEHTDNRSNGSQTIAARAEEKARELGEAARQEAAHRAHDIGERAQQRIEAQRDQVASRIEGAALRLRERGDTAGPIGHTAGEQVAGRMEAAAGYLHEHHTNEIAVDFLTYVKQHPLRSILAAAVLGYLMGRLRG
jgi:ElaB/YqjD/DUF883 family membrane-anchored ribosome-binding protein